jgi:hypothetical protein
LLLALADVAADLDVPIDLHNDAAVAAMTPPTRLARLPNNPSQFPATIGPLERLLDHNRRAKIIWDHGGSDQLGGMTPARIGAMMDRHPNLYMSLRAVGSKAPVKNKLIQTSPPAVVPAWLALLRRHADRFVIGTDSFYGGPPEFARTTVNRLRAAGFFLSLLPHDLARKIGSDNAVRLYHLPPVGDLPQQSAGPEETPTKAGVAANKGARCKDGNLEHCRKLCQRGIKKACARLE